MPGLARVPSDLTRYLVGPERPLMLGLPSPPPSSWLLMCRMTRSAMSLPTVQAILTRFGHRLVSAINVAKLGGHEATLAAVTKP